MGPLAIPHRPGAWSGLMTGERYGINKSRGPTRTACCLEQYHGKQTPSVSSDIAKWWPGRSCAH
jgi:hypothetical protein